MSEVAMHRLMWSHEEANVDKIETEKADHLGVEMLWKDKRLIKQKSQ